MQRKPPYQRANPAHAAPADGPSGLGDHRVLTGFAALRAERVFGEAAVCAACTQARAEAADSEALCDEHLGQALGIAGGWDLGPNGRKL